MKSENGIFYKLLVKGLTKLNINSNNSKKVIERYNMLTPGLGKHSSFWPIQEKGGEDGAKHIGADFEYFHNPSGNIDHMIDSIKSAADTQPDGMLISLSTPIHNREGLSLPIMKDVEISQKLGDCIKEVVAAGIPVITLGRKLEPDNNFGQILHIGYYQEKLGEKVAYRFKNKGYKNSLFITPKNFTFNKTSDSFNKIVTILKTINKDSSESDFISIVENAINNNKNLDSIFSLTPDISVEVQKIIDKSEKKIAHACFGINPQIKEYIKSNKILFAVDEAPRLQSYQAIINLHLYNTYAGLTIDTDDGLLSTLNFIDKNNVYGVAAMAGIDR